MSAHHLRGLPDSVLPSRTFGGQGRDRTGDTRIFSPLLYQLSYLATRWAEMVGAQGFEPWTQWLRVTCSTSWATLPFHRVPLCFKWSELRDSNPRQSPWQGDTLPTELSSQCSVKTSNMISHFLTLCKWVFKKNYFFCFFATRNILPTRKTSFRSYTKSDAVG